MVSARRLVSLRLTAMAALCVSTLLVYDTLHPERAFCSLAQSCERVRESALGRIGGVPTSVLGMAAFGGLFLLTLLPVEAARRVLRPAGLVSAVAGAGLFAYQALVIGSFCPLCLVADGAGLVAGLLTLTWGELPRRRSGRKLTGEATSARVAWVLAVLLAVVLPFAWPRSVEKAWVEIAPTESLFDEDAVNAPASQVAHARAVPPAVDPVERLGWPLPDDGPEPPAFSPLRPGAAQPPSADGPEPTRSASPAPPRAPHPAMAPTSSSTRPAGSAPAGLASDAPRAATPAATFPTPAPILIVEYVNAYCAHCRATHRRLGQLLRGSTHPVRIRRVLTWAGDATPPWARACAFAATQGLEDAYFDALLDTREGTPQELFAAARRVGLDAVGLKRALNDPQAPLRLTRDRQLFQSAGLRGLPTLDIGRRRLMGEQSEAELRAALDAGRLAPAGS